jgi:hypothetical protein
MGGRIERRWHQQDCHVGALQRGGGRGRQRRG